jgi:probable nitrogen fixation protein
MEQVANLAERSPTAFEKVLVSIVRAEDSYGAWDKKTDAVLLSDFVVDKEARRALPIVGDPDPEIVHKVEQFYRAVGLRIEQETGLMASPTIKLHHEGFGRLFITVGRLVAFAKTLRDVHRFGFDSLDDLSRQGEKTVQKAVEDIQKYREVATA